MAEDFKRYVARICECADDPNDVFQESFTRRHASRFAWDDPVERRRCSANGLVNGGSGAERGRRVRLLHRALQMEEVQIRGSRAAALAALSVGVAGLVALLLVEFLRTPLLTFVVLVTLLAGLFALFDRRVKVSFSDAGIRYSGWGRGVVPWHELAGYRWTTWRHQAYLQLFPRRPTELVAGFSPVGKLNHFCARLVRMPPFSIGAYQLEVSAAKLTELTARYLPEQPPAA